MDVREKLVELLNGVQHYGTICTMSQMDDRYARITQVSNTEVAERLIANGVTVQGATNNNVGDKRSPTADTLSANETGWISVKDRLPEEGDYVLCVLKGFNYGGKIQVCKFVPADKFKDKPYFEHFRNGFPSVTHWMPLPEPPKGE